MVAGADGPAVVPSDPEVWRALVAELEGEGVTRKDAILDVARRAGVPKREVYDVVHRVQP